MTKRLSYLAAGLCGMLLFFVTLTSCFKDDGGEDLSNGVFKSATYRISGRVVDESQNGLAGIRVEMKSGKGVALDDGENSIFITDRKGDFVVEVLSSNVKAEELVLEFTDPDGKYHNNTVRQPLQDVGFIGGDGLLYLGYYATNLKVNVVMKLKANGTDEKAE